MTINNSYPTVKPKAKMKLTTSGYGDYNITIEDLATYIGSSSTQSSVTTQDITDASEIGRGVIKAETANAVRSLIGAGTSNLTIGTTSTTASAGNHSHSSATTTTSGFMSNTDKSKLDSIAQNANNYVLPQATTSTIGGVMKVSGVEDTSGEDLLAVKNTLNELLANLRLAGIMT